MNNCEPSPCTLNTKERVFGLVNPLSPTTSRSHHPYLGGAFLCWVQQQPLYSVQASKSRLPQAAGPRALEITDTLQRHGLREKSKATGGLLVPRVPSACMFLRTRDSRYLEYGRDRLRPCSVFTHQAERWNRSFEEGEPHTR